MDENLPTSAGLSSFNLLDERRFFDALALRDGMTVLDLACGLGNYAVAASPLVGDKGVILAMDLWKEGIETLTVRAQVHKLRNIHPMIADAGSMPVRGGCIDCCLMATIVHILARENKLEALLRQMRHILRPAGTLAVVEFKKVDAPPGPPVTWRLSPDELQGILSSLGYRCVNTVAVGPYNYLALFHST